MNDDPIIYPQTRRERLLVTIIRWILFLIAAAVMTVGLLVVMDLMTG